MSRAHRKPWPFHCTLGGIGLMLTVDPQSGELSFKDEAASPPGPQGVGVQKRLLDDWSGGVGLRRTPHEGGDLPHDPAADRMLHVMQAVAGTGTDLVGGGLDPRFGGLLKGPRIRNPITVWAGQPITRLVEFTPLGGATVWVAAVGSKVYKSTTVDWSAGVVDITPTGISVEVLDLAVAYPRKSAPELRIAYRDWPTYTTTDAVPASGTWMADGSEPSGKARPDKPLAVYRWTAAAGTFSDGTSVTTDGNPATALDVSGLPTTDYLLVGYKHRATGLTAFVGSANSNAVALRVQYRQAAGWATVSGLSDLTAVAGASLGQSGDIAWGLPGGDWVPTVLATELQGEELYFLKLDWPTGGLDGSTTITDITLQYRLQIDAIGVAGPEEVFSAHGNTFLSTEFGGVDGLVNDTSDKYATRSGEVIGAVTWQDTVYFRKTDGLFTVDAAGKAVDVLPELRREPTSSRTGQGLAVWDNALWVASDYTLRRLTPDGQSDVIGPERLTLGDNDVRLRATALCGDRDFFLLAAFLGSDGVARLGSYRTYRRFHNQFTGQDQWVPQDAWVIGLADLGARTITSMAVFTAGGQPWLVMGASDGVILASKLAVGLGPPPEFSDIDGEALLPTYDGYDGSREIVAVAATIQGRGFVAAHQDMLLYTKLPTDTSWTLQGTFGASGQGLTFPTPHHGYGLDVKVRLRTDDHALSPHLDLLGLRYRQQLDQVTNRKVSLVVQAHDRVTDLRGNKIRRSAGDWGIVLRATLGGTDVPLVLVTPSGWQFAVMADAVTETIGRARPTDQPAAAFALELSAAS